MSTERPSRRAVIKAGAWTAPAVVVATAVPAFAASVPGSGGPGSGDPGSGGPGSGGPSLATLTVDWGQTRVDNGAVSGYDGLRCDALTIQGSQALLSDELTLTITATTSAGDPTFVYVRESAGHTDLSPWVARSPQNSPEQSIVYTYPFDVAAGEPATATGNAVLAVNSGYGSISDPIITVVVSAPGFASVSRQFRRGA